MRISRGHAKALCEHGFTNDVFDQKRALRDCPESWLRIMTRLHLPIKPPLRLKMKKIEKAMLEGEEDEVEKEL